MSLALASGSSHPLWSCHSHLILLIPHPQAERFQDPPQLSGLHLARVVDIDELEGFPRGLQVSEDLHNKEGFWKS